MASFEQNFQFFGLKIMMDFTVYGKKRSFARYKRVNIECRFKICNSGQKEFFSGWYMHI